MKPIVSISIICLALAIAPRFAFAEEDSCSPDSDVMQRAQLRLRDLGYYTDSIDGTDNPKTRSAIESYCLVNDADAKNGMPPSGLFTIRAMPAPVASFASAETAVLSEAPTTVFGTAIPWQKASAYFTMDAAYTLTHCFSGLSCQMRYIGGSNHAHLTPLDDRDADTLRLIFGDLHDYSKQPVVVTLGASLRAAASLQATVHSDDAGDADTLYSLYFAGSVSDVGGILDVDHERTVLIASGK